MTVNEHSIITLENLVKKYNGHTAFDGVSFEIDRGEIFGLLGPNGAGKSTLISMMCCLLEFTSGTIIIEGFDIDNDSFEIKKIIGVVPQEISLYHTLTAQDKYRCGTAA